MGTLLSLGATGMLVGIGVSTRFLAIVVALWLGMSVVPVAQAMSHSIWLAKVEPDVQGRVFAVRSMIAQATGPIALALAGRLADRVFVPLMTGSSDLGVVLQRYLGSGEGAAYGSLFVAVGLYTIIMAVIS
jgi:hypothetical protein